MIEHVPSLVESRDDDTLDSRHYAGFWKYSIMIGLQDILNDLDTYSLYFIYQV